MKRETNQRHTFFKNFLVSSTGTAFSRIFGFLRDITISHYFGANKITDIFWIAFTIPNVFRRFVADEGLTGAIIPLLGSEEHQTGQEGAKSLANTTFTFLILINVLLCFFGILFAPFLFTLFGSGFVSDPQDFQLGINLTRWLFSFVMFVSLVSFCEGILNYRNHYFLPKVAPGIVSASVVISVPLLYNSLQNPIYAIVIGILAGGLLHFLIQLPKMARLWQMPSLSFSFKHPRFRQFVNEMGKVIAIGLFAQLNIIILRTLASNLDPGSVTWYWYAIRLMDLAQGIIAVGMGSALLPVLSKAVNNNDWFEFQDQFLYSIRLTGFILLPVGIGLAIWSVPTVNLVFRHGDFTLKDALITAETLFFLIPSMWATAGIGMVKKIYFALNLRSPLIIIGAFGSVVIFGIGVLFMQYYDIQGLAITLSIVSSLQLTIYFIHLKKILKNKIKLLQLLSPLLKMVAVSLIASLVLVCFHHLGNWSDGPSMFNIFIYLLAWFCFAIVYSVCAKLLNIRELNVFLSIIKRKK